MSAYMGMQTMTSKEYLEDAMRRADGNTNLAREILVQGQMDIYLRLARANFSSQVTQINRELGKMETAIRRLNASINAG